MRTGKPSRNGETPRRARNNCEYRHQLSRSAFELPTFPDVFTEVWLRVYQSECELPETDKSTERLVHLLTFWSDLHRDFFHVYASAQHAAHLSR